MTVECRLEDQGRQPTLAIRFRAPVAELTAQFTRVYTTLMQYLADLGEAPVGPPYAKYHNMDMADLDVEAGFPVAKLLPGKGEVMATELSASRTATALHVGPYAAVEATYNALMAWIGQQGLTMSGPPYEFYLNDPAEVPESELQTKVVVPIGGP